MTDIIEGSLGEETIAFLRETYRRLGPDDKMDFLRKAATAAEVEIGFRTSNSEQLAVPVSYVRAHYPTDMSDALLKSLPISERKFIGVLEEQVPKNPCPSVEWYTFVQASLDAIPPNDFQGDLADYVRSKDPTHGDELTQAAIKSISEVAGIVSGVPLNGPLRVRLGQDIMWDFLGRSPEAAKEGDNFSKILYSLSDFVTGYLSVVDQKSGIFTIPKDRLDALTQL